MSPRPPTGPHGRKQLMSFRTRSLVAMLLLVTLVAATTLVGLEVGMRHELRDRLTASIEEYAQHQAGELDERFADLLGEARLVASGSRVRDALAAVPTDAAALEAVVDEIRAIRSWELLALAAADGSARAWRGTPAETGWPAALAGAPGREATRYWSDGTSLYQVVAVPIFSGGRVVGRLVGGSRLSSRRVAAFERRARAAVAAFADGRLVVTSFPAGSLPRSDVARLGRGATPPRVRLGGEWFLARDVRTGDPNVRLTVFRSEDVALAPYRGLRSVVLGTASFACALAILAAWLLSRGLSRPVATLERERAVTQQLFESSEERFRQLIERASDAIAVYDHERFVYVNPAFVQSLGYASPEDVVGKPVLDIVHPDDREEVARRVGGMFQTREAAPPREFRYLRRDGGIVIAEVASQPIEFRSRPAMLTIARDVTERRQTQARMLQTDRMTSLGTLAAGVAHEINNPLSYLIANLDYVSGRLDQLARDNPQFVASPAPTRPGRLTGSYPQVRNAFEDMAEPLAEAREGAERVRQIVRDLKTFSRPDDERRGPIDVRRVLESSINVAFNEIRHRARLVKDYGEVPQVEASEARLGQIFLNLLVNAAQAIPDGDANKNEVRVVTRSEGGRVIVEIRDTGCGIPQEIRARIFDPFFTTKPVGVGTGLGLAIVHTIATSLGGTIDVESEVGRGTTVRLSLPPLREQAATPVPDTGPAPPSPRARVLVIDDEAALGTALRRALGSEHDVAVTTSGREGLELLLGDGAFDVVFCDLAMPDVTGMDVFEEIRKSRPGLENRLVFMTGGAFTARAREFLSSVPNLRIEKPFDMQNVRAVVRERAPKA